MTKDEYVYWSDCRQASFTFRKAKRFREWASQLRETLFPSSYQPVQLFIRD